MKVTYSVYKKTNDCFFEATVDEITTCPLCHATGHPHFEGGHMLSRHDGGTTGVYIFTILYCLSCQQHFIAKYFGTSGNYQLQYVVPSNSEPQTFDEIIANISPDFINIYNQSKQAENMGLDELVGIGYRKSLEFLIKDYLIKVKECDENEIKAKTLAQCIRLIEDNKIKTLATGATWIGNDETHYEPKHPEYGVEHMKLFIKTLVEFIVGEDAFLKALALIDQNQNN